MAITKMIGRNRMTCWKFDGRDAAGIRIRKTFYNEAEALRFEADFRERKTRNIVEPTRRLFPEAAESYLYDRRECRSYSKMKHYTLCLCETWAHAWLDEITIGDVRRYREKLARQHSVYRANRELEILSAILNHAEENQWILRAPKVKKLSGEIPRDRYLKPDEIQCLFRHEPHAEKRLLLGILLYTGMRKSDTISLEWVHVDFEKGLILNRNTKADHLRKGKQSSKRWLPIAEPLMALFCSVSREHHRWVFPSPRGHAHISNIDKWWIGLRDRTGLTDIRIHDLRRTAATFLAMATGSTLAGQRMLGHHTGKMAEQYANPDHTWLQAGVDQAAELMEGFGHISGHGQKNHKPQRPKVLPQTSPQNGSCGQRGEDAFGHGLGQEGKRGIFHDSR